MHELDATRRSPARFLVGAALLSLVLAACSSGTTPTPSAAAATSAADATSAAAPPSAAATRSASASAAAGSEMSVTLQNFAFSPSTLTVPVGSTVTFTNNDSTKHTATNGKDGKKADGALFDLQLEPGASDTFTFETAGTFEVTCTIHSQMNMTITVQ
jgi:plastocyanin